MHRASYSTTHWTWQKIYDWTYVMPQKLGSVVKDLVTGEEYSWPDAIARELYGPEWRNHPDYIQALDLEVWEPAPKPVINLLDEWAANPAGIDWAIYQR